MSSAPLNPIRTLLDKVTALREEVRHEHADGAPNFNLFHILGVHEKEVSTHSAFIAHLLDPRQSHAQGDLFLNEFFRMLGKPDLADFSDWAVFSELSFAGGRLDIVLQSVKAETIIVIENKIYTLDAHDQLSVYHEWLDRPQRKRAFKNLRLLLFLTLKGEPSKFADPRHYTSISYDQNIKKWLRACPAKAKRVSDAIATYLQTVQNLVEPTLMKDELDKKVLALIKTPEDRVSALRIIRVGKQLKEQLLQDFWKRGELFLRNKLADPKFSRWQLERSEGSVLEKGYSIRLFGKKVDKTKGHPSFVFWQHLTPSMFRWELCVNFDSWRGDRERITGLSEARKLTLALDGNSLPSKHGWDGYKPITKDYKGMELTLEENQSNEAYFVTLFEEGWALFKKIELPLRQLTNAVVRRRG